jgi:L-glutamine-phosphate cytidylyltransferase
MKAIILLAGDGSRMGPFSINTPKSLLELEERKTMLEHQLKVLSNCNINEIVLVLGFKKELIRKKIESIKELNRKKVTIYFNPLYKVTENAFSLWASREAFNDDILIINGDVLFNEEALQDLIKEKAIHSLLIKKKKCDQEDQKVEVQNNFIIKVGKKLSLDIAYGEVMGVGKIRKKGLSFFKEMLFKAVEENPLIYWPEVFNYIIKKGYKVNIVLANSFYSDMDTKEDYIKIKKILKKGISIK